MKLKLPSHPLARIGAAAVVLALLAWFGSVQEMLALDLPIVAVGLVAVLFDWNPQPRPGVPARRLTPLAQGLLVAATLALVAGAGYVLWGRWADTGLVGWLDAVQARDGGRYSARLSLIAAIADLLLAYGAAVWAIIVLGIRRVAGGAAATAAGE